MIVFNNFRTLDPETADLARELIDHSREQRSVFSSFANLWMGFNGWMECVTGAETDAAMIAAIAESPRASHAYDKLMADEEFRSLVVAFAKMWPVLNVRDVRKKLGRDAFWRLSRANLLQDAVRMNVRIQPLEWIQGAVPSWPQLLRTVYLIRCNMFHGAKSPENFRDHQLVLHSDHIIRKFIDKSGCFDWVD